MPNRSRPSSGSSASTPIILATWSFGVTACRAGWDQLIGDQKEGKNAALNAVEAAARAVEADPKVDSVGLGGLPDSEGNLTLDAAIMTGPGRAGSVAAVGNCLYVTTLARRVMERTNHVMLAGTAADAFAEAEGLATTESLLTEKARKVLAQWQNQSASLHNEVRMRGWLPPSNIEERSGIDDGQSVITDDHQTADGEQAAHNRFHDTVGILARTQDGAMAAACSTSGMAFKHPGRIGDSPILGHGLYCDQNVGCAIATGSGELIMGISASFLAVEFIRRGYSPSEATRKVIERVVDAYELQEQHQVAVVAMNANGEWSAAALRPGYRTAVKHFDGDEAEAADADADALLVPPEYLAFSEIGGQLDGGVDGEPSENAGL